MSHLITVRITTNDVTGKTRYFKELVSKGGGYWVRISKKEYDDINQPHREMFSFWTETTETHTKHNHNVRVES